MKKLLYCASTLSHLKSFHLPVIGELKGRGFSVFICAEKPYLPDGADGCFALPFEKRLLSFRNLAAVFGARRLLLNGKFDALVLNTALASAVFRAAALTISKKRRPEIIYICHGFLFGERDGISGLKYLIPERLLAKATDTLAVMNDEDRRLAQHFRLCEDIRRINGMGLPEGIYHIPDKGERCSARKSLGIDDDSIVFLCVGEFSDRKNQQALIRGFVKCADDIPDAILLFAGAGSRLTHCKRLAERSKVADRIFFLGYEQDILPLLFAADAYFSVSKSEGLPFSVMEALCCGLSAALSDIKGHRDLALSGNVTLFNGESALCDAMKKLYHNHDRRQNDMSGYLLSAVMPQLISLYDIEDEGE